MENVNKIISFVLGLVVVIIFLLVISGRLDIFKTKSPIFSNKSIPSPTTAAQTTTRPTDSEQKTSFYQTKSPQNIPSTGSPTLFLPLFFSSFFGGLILKGFKNQESSKH